VSIAPIVEIVENASFVRFVTIWREAKIANAVPTDSIVRSAISATYVKRVLNAIIVHNATT